jgi:hypothetical protein
MHRAQLLLREFFVMMAFVGRSRAAESHSGTQNPDQFAHEIPHCRRV